MSTVLAPPAPSVSRTPPPVRRPVSDVECARFSLEQYERMIESGVFAADDGDVELLEGLVVQKMPRNPAHDGTLDVVEGVLQTRLPADWFIRSQRAIRLPDESCPEPDLAIVRGNRRTYLTRHPSPADVGLIVEIANTSLKLDSETKARIYAKAGIPHYWIVNLLDRVVVDYSLPTGTGDASAYSVVSTRSPADSVSLILDDITVASIPVTELLV